jgi:hypothetical protein
MHAKAALISLLIVLVGVASGLAVEPISQGIRPIVASPLCGLWWNPFAGAGYFDYIEIQVVGPNSARVREHKPGPNGGWTDWVFGSLSADGRYLVWSRRYERTGWGPTVSTYTLEHRGWVFAEHRWASGPMGPFPPTSGKAIFVKVRGC